MGSAEMIQARIDEEDGLSAASVRLPAKLAAAAQGLPALLDEKLVDSQG